MAMEIERTGDMLVVHLSGDLREEAAKTLPAVLHEHLAENDYRVVIVMREVKYVSSSGIGALVRLYKDVHDRGGVICIAAASARLRDVFDVAGVTQLFGFVDDVDAGVAYLRASAPGGGAA